VLAPGSYGAVVINANGTLELSAGDYFFSTITASTGTTVAADVSGGAVTVNVVGKTRIDKNSEIGPSGGGDTSLFNFNGTGDFELKDNGIAQGNFIAPNNKVKFRKSFFKGIVCAKEIEMKETTFEPHGPSALPRLMAAVAASEAMNLNEVPAEYALGQNYPNPFNPQTIITYSLPDAGSVTLRVFNVIGQEVATLVNGVKEAGRHQVVFDASGMSSGLYLYLIQVNGFTASRRMLVLK